MKRSISGSVIIKYLKALGINQEMSVKKFYKKLRKNAIIQWEGEQLSLFKSRLINMRLTKIGGMSYYILEPKEGECITDILYLHGSAYTNKHNFLQEKFAKEIVLENRARVYFPMYPKLPTATFEDAYLALETLYNNLTQDGKKIVIIGDSSGGGLAVGLAQLVKIPPKLVIAISPWLDVSMCNNRIKKLEEEDVILCVPRLREIAYLWSNGKDYTDPRLSPIHGEFPNNVPLWIFAGANEVLCPDCRLFAERCRQSDVKVYYKEYDGQPHDFALLPDSEGKNAREEIKKAINIYSEKLF